MFKSISHTGIYVLDQDEALDFYVGKLGFQVGDDVDLGFMRWLTVSLPANPDHQILLEKPGPPSVSEEIAAQIRDLLTKGAMPVACILITDDCRKAHQELKAKGVEFIQEPTEQPYGTDCALRDPFGNHLRINQPAAQMGEITEDVRQRWAGDRPS